MATRHPTLACLVLLIALTGLGCDDNGNGNGTETRGSLFSPTATDLAPFISLNPSIVTPRTAGGNPCVFGQRLVAEFDLVFRHRRPRAVFLHQVRMQFADPRGVLGASAVLAMPEIIAQFRSNEIPPFGTRNFPLVLELGCLVAPAGMVSVFAETRDGDGRSETTTLQLAIGSGA